MAKSKLFQCIGGPLDGQKISTKDFSGPVYSYRYEQDPTTRYNRPIRDKLISVGNLHQYQDEYTQFNAGGRSKGVPSMVFLHKSVFK